MARVKKRRIVVALTVALALIGIAGAGTVLYVQNAAADEHCPATTAPAAAISEGSTRVYVIGDSYTAGTGLEDRTDGWVYQLAKINDWSLIADGIGGTGFANPSKCAGNAFGDRVSGALESGAQTVIIQGGLNDWRDGEAELAAAASSVLDKLRAVPEVIIVGPTGAEARADGTENVDEILRDVAAQHGRTYVSTLDWALDFLPDNLHLTPAGHQQFAEQIAAAIAG